MTGTDWLVHAARTGRYRKANGARRAGLTLVRPDVTLEQVPQVIRGARSSGALRQTTGKPCWRRTGYDFAVIDAARALEDVFAELAAAAAEKMVQIRR